MRITTSVEKERRPVRDLRKARFEGRARSRFLYRREWRCEQSALRVFKRSTNDPRIGFGDSPNFSPRLCISAVKSLCEQRPADERAPFVEHEPYPRQGHDTGNSRAFGPASHGLSLPFARSASCFPSSRTRRGPGEESHSTRCLSGYPPAKYKTAIFVHGCFWHRHRGCKNCTTPTNREWWIAKLEGNAA
jgi:hypothetical protein